MHIASGCQETNLEIQQPHLRIDSPHRHLKLLGQEWGLRRIAPEALRGESAENYAALHRIERLMQGETVSGLFAPVVSAVDVSERDPEGAMMRMVGSLASNALLHRIGACDPNAIRSAERIEVGAGRNVLIEVAGEQGIAHPDFQRSLLLSD